MSKAGRRQLVNVNARSDLTNLPTLASSPELNAQVSLLSRLPEEDLACLYRNCLFTLYPSHYEGWGLPVTESLSWGKAALISDASSRERSG